MHLANSRGRGVERGAAGSVRGFNVGTAVAEHGRHLLHTPFKDGVSCFWHKKTEGTHQIISCRGLGHALNLCCHGRCGRTSTVGSSSSLLTPSSYSCMTTSRLSRTLWISGTVPPPPTTNTPCLLSSPLTILHTFRIRRVLHVAQPTR